MRVGSRVTLVDDRWPIHKPTYELCRIPKKETVYTVRDIVISVQGIKIQHGPSIRLNEIVNPKLVVPSGFVEPFFRMCRFRETGLKHDEDMETDFLWQYCEDFSVYRSDHLNDHLYSDLLDDGYNPNL